MINLILKDIDFNKKYFLIGLLASLGFSSIILDGNQYAIGAYLMVPSLLFSTWVGKICYIEDSTSVYNFLFSLPIKKSDIVVSKYIISYLTLFVGYCIFAIMNGVLGCFTNNQYDLLSKSLFYIYSVCILYNSLYLFLNFKYSYANAQQTVYVFFVFYMSLFASMKYLNRNVNSIIFLNDWTVCVCVLTLSLIISLIMCFLSIKAFSEK